MLGVWFMVGGGPVGIFSGHMVCFPILDGSVIIVVPSVLLPTSLLLLYASSPLPPFLVCAAS